MSMLCVLFEMESNQKSFCLPSHTFLKIVYYTKATKMLILECRSNCLLLNLLWNSKCKDSKYFPIYIILWSISVGAEYNIEYNHTGS